MTTSKTVPPEALRFLRESRVSIGRQAFVHYLTVLREDSIYRALYGSDRDARDINAGRAQAWSEVLSLFTDV